MRIEQFALHRQNRDLTFKRFVLESQPTAFKTKNKLTQWINQKNLC